MMGPSLGPRALSGWTAGEGGAFGLNVSPWGFGWPLGDAGQCEGGLCGLWWSSVSDEGWAESAGIQQREEEVKITMDYTVWVKTLALYIYMSCLQGSSSLT